MLFLIFDVIAENPGDSVLFVDNMSLNFMSVNLIDSGNRAGPHVCKFYAYGSKVLDFVHVSQIHMFLCL